MIHISKTSSLHSSIPTHMSVISTHCENCWKIMPLAQQPSFLSYLASGINYRGHHSKKSKTRYIRTSPGWQCFLIFLGHKKHKDSCLKLASPCNTTMTAINIYVTMVELQEYLVATITSVHTHHLCHPQLFIWKRNCSQFCNVRKR